jgi:hypothetical protein
MLTAELLPRCTRDHIIADVGIALWAAAGTLAFLLARIVPLARRRSWLAELIAAIGTALLFGLIATYLDFGGWKELDWRAGVFTFLTALAALGLVRAKPAV